jgi:homoserine O-succinyltransferase
MIYFQGHPEYDRNSLLKEYKREVKRFSEGSISRPPPLPQYYFTGEAAVLAERLVAEMVLGQAEAVPALEAELEDLLDNTWGDTAKAVVNNWLGLVYRVTNLDRKLQFMEGVDADDPLQLKSRNEPKTDV